MRIGVFILACVAPFVANAGANATSVPAHVSFFTQELADPVHVATRAVRLFELCATKFAQQCRSDAVTPEELRTIDFGVFDRVTVFGKQSSRAVWPGGWQEWATELGRTREQFMNAYLEYENSVLPRMGAVYAMCPDSERRDVAALVDTIRLVNFGRYWQLSGGVAETHAR